MTLHMLRLDIDSFAAQRWFAAEGLVPPPGTDDGYGWHALLSTAFGKERAPKPFRAMSRRGRNPYLLAYAEHDPVALERDARSFADPLVLSAFHLGGEAPLAAKTMPSLSAGSVAGFSVLLRPTLRMDRAGERTKTREIDAFFKEKQDAGMDGRVPNSAKDVYLAWSRAKLEAGGARLLDLQLDGIDRIAVLRRDANRKLRSVPGHAVSVKGKLAVTDPEAFANALKRGVGRHRAFGYGMLLLSPP
jgi:CRISPR system Cascade subunit CasE